MEFWWFVHSYTSELIKIPLWPKECKNALQLLVLIGLLEYSIMHRHTCVDEQRKSFGEVKLFKKRRANNKKIYKIEKKTKNNDICTTRYIEHDGEALI